MSFDAEGDLFGATNLGGSTDSGAVFEIARDGAYSLLHSFDGGSGGSDPNAGVTIDPQTGDLYGTTTFGGNPASRNGCGVLYRLSSKGDFEVLHSFDDANDGRYPAGQLLRDKKGNFFGAATSGGPGLGGAIFEWTNKGKFKLLHAFSDSDGFQPQGGLLLGRDGNLYGATYSGGAHEYGTIFRLTPKGELITLYAFAGGADGGYPAGGLAMDGEGDLFGATNLAGDGGAPFGTVFKLAPDGALTTLYAFAGGADGGYPAGNILLSKGKLYGSTTAGGSEELGVIYQVDAASGAATVIHDFADADGAVPQAGVVKRHGRLYGMASGGGADEFGVVYSLKK